MKPVWKCLLAVTLCITALFLCIFLSSPAKAAVVNSGSCGANATWTLTDDGILTISGSGAMNNATSISQIGWWDDRESVIHIVIEDGITHIGSNAFYLCTNVTDVSIPESVTSLGQYAFASCVKITQLTLPGDITTLPTNVFGYCTALSSISLPDTLTTVGDSAFYGCASLTELPLPDSVTTIDRDAFSECLGLQEITLPKSLKTLGSYAFSNCSYLQKVTFGPNLRSIDYYAFLYCHSLTEITFQGNAPSLNSNAFARITATCYYPENDPTWQGVANRSYGGTITWSAYTPENQEPVGGQCGDNVYWTITNESALIISGTGDMYDFNWEPAPWYDFGMNLKSLIVEEGVTGIGNAAFQDCQFFQVSLPQSLQRIGNVAFVGCNNLVQIDLPKNLQTLGSAPFWRSENLMYVNVAAENPYFCNDGQSVLLNKNKTKLIWGSPATLTGMYFMPETVTSLGDYPFYDCDNLDWLILSPNLKQIEGSAFAYCSRLTKITIPASVTSIDNEAFYGCSALTELLFCGDAPSLSSYSFYGLTAKAYFPVNNSTWSSVTSSSYGGKITWIGCDPEAFCQYGHTYGDWFITWAPRCVIDGMQRRYCVNCSAYEESVATAPGHIYTEVTVPAGEDTAGYTQYSCKGCCSYILSFSSQAKLTRSDAVQMIRYLVSEQDNSISVTYYDDTPASQAVAQELYQLAAGHGAAPHLGDYLTRHPVFSLTCSGSGYMTQDGLYRNTVSYKLIYTTTYEAEEYVDSKIEMILEQLDLEGKTDFEKIKLIHDYICDNVHYVMSSLTEHTCYGALRYGQAVCQGYALLTYRLMMESGIDCRYISGTSRNQPHAWNIVRLGDVYYNIDTTWDDNYGHTVYTYFLRADNDFDDHVRDAEYATEEFYAQYPMAEGSYFFGSERTIEWMLTPDGTLTISGTGSVFDNPCPGYEDRVKTLIIEEGITTIGMDAFANYTALSQVSLPRSLEFISFDAFENCTMLQTVAYGGYPTDKAKLSIASGNDALLQATWTYAECPAHQYEAVCSPVCTICGAERITQHTPGSWQSNDDFHSRDCALCGTPLETEAHDFVDGICNVCAHQKRSGDFTQDGQVNNEDVIYLLWHTMFPKDYPLISRGDFTRDGQVNNEDVIYLLWHTMFPDGYPL